MAKERRARSADVRRDDVAQGDADRGGVGRNDPCPCGSGKKYKQCCMAKDKAAQAERVAWERAAQNMRVALIGYAKEKQFVRDLALGLGLFWQDRYTADTVHMMSIDESLRFFDWFAHDYRMQFLPAPESAAGGEPTAPAGPAVEPGKRLIEMYRTEVADALTDKESATLDEWIASWPGSAFVIEETDVEQGTVVLQDLLLPERRITVHNAPAAQHGEIGQILLARPLPEHQAIRLSGATAVLPASEQKGLRAYMEQVFLAYRKEPGPEGEQVVEPAPAVESAPGSSWDTTPLEERLDFLRERAYLLTHYALEWAEREGRPAVTAQDPAARKPGQALQRLIRWGQERVQAR